MIELSCERCRTVYELDPQQLKRTSTKVKCSHCGYIFRVIRQEKEASQSPSFSEGWDVHFSDGTNTHISELSTLQRWVVEGKITPTDGISSEHLPAQPAENLLELQPFFRVVEQASLSQQALPQFQATPTNTSPKTSAPPEKNVDKRSSPQSTSSSHKRSSLSEPSTASDVHQKSHSGDGHPYMKDYTDYAADSIDFGEQFSPLIEEEEDLLSPSNSRRIGMLVFFVVVGAMFVGSFFLFPQWFRRAEAKKESLEWIQKAHTALDLFSEEGFEKATHWMTKALNSENKEFPSWVATQVEWHLLLAHFVQTQISLVELRQKKMKEKKDTLQKSIQEKEESLQTLKKKKDKESLQFEIEKLQAQHSKVQKKQMVFQKQKNKLKSRYTQAIVKAQQYVQSNMFKESLSIPSIQLSWLHWVAFGKKNLQQFLTESKNLQTDSWTKQNKMRLNTYQTVAYFVQDPERPQTFQSLTILLKNKEIPNRMWMNFLLLRSFLQQKHLQRASDLSKEQKEHPLFREFHHELFFFLKTEMEKKQKKQETLAAPQTPKQKISQKRTSKKRQIVAVNFQKGSYQQLLQAARSFSNKGQYAQAIRYFGASLQKKKSGEALSGIGWAYLAQSKRDKAQKYFEKALAVGGNVSKAYFGMGLIHRRQEKLNKAKKFLNQYLQNYPRGIHAKEVKQILQSL